MSSIVDSHIFKDIFGTSSMRNIWSDKTRTKYYLDWEIALAKVQSELDIIPKEAYELIQRMAKVENMGMNELKKNTELIGYPVLPVVQQLVKLCQKEEEELGHKKNLGDYCHFGATTQDVTDTTTIMQIRDSFDWIEHELDSIMKDVEELAREYRLQPMVARSNLQQAVPITFGFKMARLLSTLKRHKERLQQLKKTIYVLEFGGAAGNLSSLGKMGLICQKNLANELTLNQPDIAWHTERDRIAEVGCFLAMLCATLSKNATDIKLMMQTEIGEVSEPFMPHRGSSSTMPNKFNPISCVYIHSMATVVKQHSSALIEAMVADFERSTGPWEIEWIVLPEAFILTSGVLSQSKYLMSGLKVNPTKMKSNLELTKGLIVSEYVMMGLAPYLGRQQAHDLIYDLCRQAIEKDCMLVDLLKRDSRVMQIDGMTEEWLEHRCNPSNYLGLCGEMIDRVIH
ncbi:unnamed protein product [Cunninghamella echinulata]